MICNLFTKDQKSLENNRFSPLPEVVLSLALELIREKFRVGAVNLPGAKRCRKNFEYIKKGLSGESHNYKVEEMYGTKRFRHFAKKILVLVVLIFFRNSQ